MIWGAIFVPNNFRRDQKFNQFLLFTAILFTHLQSFTLSNWFHILILNIFRKYSLPYLDWPIYEMEGTISGNAEINYKIEPKNRCMAKGEILILAHFDRFDHNYVQCAHQHFLKFQFQNCMAYRIQSQRLLVNGSSFLFSSSTVQEEVNTLDLIIQEQVSTVLNGLQNKFN